MPPPNSLFHEPTILPTARVLISLHLTFFIPHPPPLPDTYALSLSPRDASAVTISQGKGGDSAPNASVSGNKRPTTKRRERSCISFGVAYFVFLLLGFPSLFRYLQYMGSRFGKLDEKSDRTRKAGHVMRSLNMDPRNARKFPRWGCDGKYPTNLLLCFVSLVQPYSVTRDCGPYPHNFVRQPPGHG